MIWVIEVVVNIGDHLEDPAGLEFVLIVGVTNGRHRGSLLCGSLQLCNTRARNAGRSYREPSSALTVRLMTSS